MRINFIFGGEWGSIYCHPSFFSFHLFLKKSLIKICHSKKLNEISFFTSFIYTLIPKLDIYKYHMRSSSSTLFLFDNIGI